MMIQTLASQRLSDFRRMLTRAGLDGYVTTDRLEQQYFSGVSLFEGEAIFLITRRKGYCFTKRLIAGKMKRLAGFLQTEDVGACSAQEVMLEVVKRMGLAQVVFDPRRIDCALGMYLLEAGLGRAEGLVEEMRMKKYADELKRIRKSCQIAAAAFEEVKTQIRTGMTEEDVRLLISLALYKRGAESIPFNIVCFGANTADVHHTPSKHCKLKAQDAVLLDFGCCYEGYVSDMTRSWWHGDKAPVEYRRIWNLVEQARRAGIRVLRAGISAGAVDAASRTVIEKAGYGKAFFHTTGHSIGLQEHERPILRAGSPDVLEENYVVTIEPGVYFDGRWGVRLEDSFLVTQTGSKKLTQK